MLPVPNVIFPVPKIKEASNDIPQNLQELHGIFEGIDTPDKKGLRKALHEKHGKISIDDAYGIFKGIDTHFERDEEDRI